MDDEAMVEQAAAVPPPPDLTGVPEQFHSVVEKHGRALWALVFNANMAQEALRIVAVQSQKHQSRALGHAGLVLGQVLNDQGSAYAAVRGWDQAAIDACEADIKLAVAGKGRIQLLN